LITKVAPRRMGRTIVGYITQEFALGEIDDIHTVSDIYNMKTLSEAKG
jgi:hypothetical protein